MIIRRTLGLEVKDIIVETEKALTGITKIFLFTNGNIGGSKELKDLLHFFNETTKANAVDEELSDMQRVIDEIKHNAEVGDRYMHYLTYEEYFEMKAQRTAEIMAENMAKDIKENQKAKSMVL